MIPAECCHWANWREGGPTRFDLQELDLKNKKAKEIWEKDLELLQGTEQELFCNTDGHFKDMKQVNNILQKYNEPKVSSDWLNVFKDIASQPQKWMAIIMQQGIDYKDAHLKKEKRGLEWNDAGWYHVLDLLNITISVYHTLTCDSSFYPEVLQDGIFIDDMSNLVHPVWKKTVSFDRIC